MSIVAIAAVLAVGSAFTSRHQVGQWNVDHPEQGQPGIYFLTPEQIKLDFCPGLNNQECAYLTSQTNMIVKKP